MSKDDGCNDDDHALLGINPLARKFGGELMPILPFITV